MTSGEIGPGALLGERYRLGRRIGSGGMATVWLATDARLRRRVAVKVLSDALAADEGYRARFEREARVAASVSHPNLVNVFDFGSAGERPYLVMEYVEGRTLAAVLDDDGSQVDARALARGLLGALGAIHAAGIVHRDVKPANVLVGADGRFMLTDFGIARAGDATRLTETGYVIGTLRYMAPEVRDGAPATPRSDLYACGVVVSECLGRHPPAALAALAAELTREDPAERPASADAALAVLEGAPAPASRGRALTPFRVLAVVGLGAAVALGLIQLLGGGGDSAREVSRATGDRTPSRQSTITLTKTASTTATVAAPAPPGPQPATACAALDARKQTLAERQHAADERLKENPTAKARAHARFDAQQHALDDRIKACQEREKGGPP